MRPLTLLLGLALGIALALYLSDQVGAEGPCVPQVREVPADSPAVRFEPTARGVGRDLQVPADLIVRTIHVESRGDPLAVSYAGARGLMQIMGFWWRPGERWWDSYENVRKGTSILRANFERRGDWQLASRAFGGWSGYEKLIFECEEGE